MNVYVMRVEYIHTFMFWIIVLLKSVAIGKCTGRKWQKSIPENVLHIEFFSHYSSEQQYFGCTTF